MARLAIYHDGTDSALRITKDNADNPWDVAVGDYGKLHFDSLNQNQVAPIAYTDVSPSYFGIPSSIGTSYDVRWPIGSSAAECTHIFDLYRKTASTVYTMGPWELLERTVGIDYPPVISAKRWENGWFLTNEIIEFYQNNSAHTQHYGVVSTFASYSQIKEGHDFYTGWVATAKNEANNWSFYRWDSVDDTRTLYHGSYKSVVWPMPADNRAFTQPEEDVAEGNVLAKFTNSTIKIARQGFDVATATDQQLLLDANNSPAMIIKTGEVSVSGGATISVSLPSGITYDDDLHTELIAYEPGSAVIHPSIGRLVNGVNSRVQQGLRSRVSGGNLEINNRSSYTLVVRYIVFRVSPPNAASSGGPVLLTANDGTQDYIQLRKPGAPPTPRIDDVLLDTRFPYVPIIAEGWWDITSTGNSSINAGFGSATGKKLEVNLTNLGGWKPFPIWMTTYSDGHIRGGRMSYAYSTAPNFYSCLTNVAKIEDNKITFMCYRDNPEGYKITNNQIATYNGPRPNGLRYYIFAVPT